MEKHGVEATKKLAKELKTTLKQQASGKQKHKNAAT